jgi:hypothetical protein
MDERMGFNPAIAKGKMLHDSGEWDVVHLNSHERVFWHDEESLYPVFEPDRKIP